MKRAVSVLTASMFLLSGIVLTAGPANAASTETVPYTYTVKVPVTKTVYEYQVVKTKVGNRTVYTYQRVAKTKTEYRVETRTGYREAPVKAADKPAAAEFKVQVADTANFKNLKKEILVTPSASGTNKVNLSNQLAGNVGDVAYVRVVAKNAAGKSTPGRVSKLAFGEVSRSNYDVQVAYTDYATRQTAAAYTTRDFIGYGTKTEYENVWDYVSRSYSYYEDYTAYRTVREPYTAYRSESYTYYVDVPYQASYVSSYECGYWSYYPYKRYVSKTCKETVRYTAYREEARTGTRQVAYTAYRNVQESYTATRLVNVPYQSYEIVGQRAYSVTDYSNPQYGPSYVVPAQYETYAYTAYRTETRTQINNGWKASN